VSTRSRWIVIVLTIVVVGGLAAAAVAFGGGDGGNNSSTGSGVNGSSSGATSSPSPNAAACTMDPNFDYGQTICVTATGVKPRWLVSRQNTPITWRNETSTPLSITFVAGHLHSGPIPPHGTWSYTPKYPLSLAYHVSTGPGLGRIQVLAPES
jgi:hypothetical protein